MHRILILISLTLHFLTSFESNVFGAVNMTANNLGTVNTISISDTTDLKSAVFMRGNKLWIVLDKKIEDKKIGRNTIFENFGQVELPGSNASITFFEVDKPSQYEFTLSQSSNTLNINITPYDNTILPREVPSNRIMDKEFSRSGNKLLINTVDSELISFVDPLVGDKIFAALEPIAQRSVKSNFVDFKVLESLSGIVIQQVSDSLNVELKDNRIEISSSTKLNISDYKINTEHTLLISENAIANLKNYRTAPHHFNKELNRLYYEISQVTDNTAKANEYLKLGIFLLANQWYLESKAVFDIFYRLQPVMMNDYRVQIITVVSYFMCKAFGEADEIAKRIDISKVPIKYRSEVRFWQKLLSVISEGSRSNSGDDGFKMFNIYSLAKKILHKEDNFLSTYNSDIFNEIFFKVIDVSATAGDAETSRKLIKATYLPDLKNNQRRLIQYYKGLALPSEPAVERFRECANEVTDRYTYSHCRFELLNILFKDKKIDVNQYINGLQGVSTIWRGDQFEIDVLNRMADTYHAFGDQIDAIRIWTMISKIQKQSYVGIKATGKAMRAFIDFFKQNDSSPLTQLAFFYEFKDLTPLGIEGDMIIMQTAYNMISLNLLEQAVKVMEYQIQNRLVGIDREKIINELVKAYNDLDDWVMSLQTVESFTKFPISKNNPLLLQREYLYAKAIAQENGAEQAIALLKNNKSNTADKLRAEIFFKERQWNDFNDNSEPHIYSILNLSSPIDKDDGQKLLKQSISYFNNNQLSLLQNLYLDFRPRLKKNDIYAEKQKLLYKIANELKAEDFSANKETLNYLKKLIKQVSEIR